MPDWRAIVEQHFAVEQLPASERKEICRELAAHLEDRFVALRQSLPEEEAERKTRSLLGKPQILLREIGNLEQEEHMNRRMQSLWIPGFVMLAAYTLLFVALVRLGAYAGDPGPMFLGKVVLLVVFGAVGAWWARTLGATPMQRALVGVAPGLMTVVSFVIAFPVHAWKSGGSLLTSGDGQGAAIVVDGILIPIVALLLGAFPFLKDSEPKPEANSQRLAGA